MSELFLEIEESLKADRLDRLWKKFGSYAVIASVGIIVITIAAVAWQHYAHSKAMEQTSLYLQASTALAKNDSKAALEKLNAIHTAEGSAYSGLVLLKKAQAYEMAGQHDEAQKHYALLAKRNDVYGDVGNLMTASADNAPSKENTLYFSRTEWRAWQLLDGGRKQEAAALFSTLANASDAPMTLRERAQMVSSSMPKKEVANEKN